LPFYTSLPTVENVPTPTTISLLLTEHNSKKRMVYLPEYVVLEVSIVKCVAPLINN